MLRTGEVPNRVPQDVTISVRLITYNQASYISQAIESVINQKLDVPFEICIGEDESNDGTREVCLNYAERYPRLIRLFLRSRKDVMTISGHTVGRFNAIETTRACRGKYIALLEGDDYWTDNRKLARQLDQFTRNPDLALCCHNTEVVDSEGKYMHLYKSVAEPTTFPTNSVIGQHCYHTSSFFFQRSDWDRIPAEIVRTVFNFDQALFWFLNTRGQVHVLSEVMSARRIQAGGIYAGLLYQKNGNLERARLALQSMRIAYDTLPIMEKEGLRVRLRRRVLRIARNALLAGKLDVALAALREWR